MNQKELEQIPLRARVVAQDVMLDLFAKHVAKILALVSKDLQADFLTGLHLKIEVVSKDVLLMTFPELPPEQSDLMAAEFQEAFDAIGHHLVKSLGIHPK